MVKKAFLRIFIAAILSVNFSLPSLAYDGFYARDRSIGAGFYLRVPFGPTTGNDDRLQYGLRLNMTREFSNSPRWNEGSLFEGRRMVNMDLMSLNFSARGFRDLSFAGRRTLVYQDGRLKFAGKNSKKGGTSFIIWVFAGLGAAALVATAVGAATRNNNDNFRPN